MKTENMRMKSKIQYYDVKETILKVFMFLESKDKIIEKTWR